VQPRDLQLLQTLADTPELLEDVYRFILSYARLDEAYAHRLPSHDRGSAQRRDLQMAHELQTLMRKHLGSEVGHRLRLDLAPRLGETSTVSYECLLAAFLHMHGWRTSAHGNTLRWHRDYKRGKCHTLPRYGNIDACECMM
jgi:hypothetical protein